MLEFFHIVNRCSYLYIFIFLDFVFIMNNKNNFILFRSGSDFSEMTTTTKKARKEVLDATEEVRNIKDVVSAARRINCCKKSCLFRLDNNVDEGDRMLTDYMTHWVNMDRKEHNEKFLAVLEGCVKGVTEGGHIEKK
jgi:hypothetical protein